MMKNLTSFILVCLLIIISLPPSSPSQIKKIDDSSLLKLLEYFKTHHHQQQQPHTNNDDGDGDSDDGDGDDDDDGESNDGENEGEETEDSDDGHDDDGGNGGDHGNDGGDGDGDDDDNNNLARMHVELRNMMKRLKTAKENKIVASAQTKIINEDPCGPNPLIISDSSSGTIYSPGYAKGRYEPQLKCAWKFVAQPGEVMKLTFQVMDIESSPLCGYDSVSVWDVVNEKAVPLGKFCGKTLPAETLKSTGRFLFVYFITDKSKGDGKFAIQYESVNPKPPEPSEDMCGKPAVQPSTRIVNGYQAVPHSWPWQVSIRLVIGSKQYHICGGSVISSSVIATAAHCFFDEKHRPHDFKSLKVVVGDHDQKTNSDGKTQSPAIQKVIYHQSYNPNSASSPYDIAVMLLQTSLTFDSSVIPICLPREDVAVNSLCFATGWGDTNETGDETVLNQVRLPIVSYTFCSQREYYGSQIIATMLCAGYDEGGKDACQGDSGGPLACYNSINKRWYLQGITSWGAGCAKPKRPGIYTRVTKYLGWIYQNSGVIS